MNQRVHVMFGVVATLIVALAIGWGFYLVGSPVARRQERFDKQRVQDLQNIAREIQDMVIDPEKKKQLKEALPQTLNDAVTRARFRRLSMSDPETGEPYKYVVKDTTTYELCATFSRPGASDYYVFWDHPAGEKCFTINVLDPPPY